LALVLAVELRFVALVVDAGTGGERGLAAAAEDLVVLAVEVEELK
jgi:hypothetical protein